MLQVRWTNVWHVLFGMIVFGGGTFFVGSLIYPFVRETDWSELRKSLVVVGIFYILIPLAMGFLIYFIPRWTDGETVVVASLSSLVFTVFLVARFWLGGFSSMSAWEALGTFWLAVFFAFGVSASAFMCLGGRLSRKLRARLITKNDLRDIANDPEIK